MDFTSQTGSHKTILLTYTAHPPVAEIDGRLCKQGLLQHGHNSTSSCKTLPYPPPSLAVLLGAKEMKGEVEALAKELENKQNKLLSYYRDGWPQVPGRQRGAACSCCTLAHVCKHVIAMQQPQGSVLGDTRHVGYTRGNQLVPSLGTGVSAGRSLSAAVLKGF